MIIVVIITTIIIIIIIDITFIIVFVVFNITAIVILIIITDGQFEKGGLRLVTLERLAGIFHIFIQKEEASLSWFQVIVTSKELTQSHCYSHPGSHDSEN